MSGAVNVWQNTSILIAVDAHSVEPIVLYHA